MQRILGLVISTAIVSGACGGDDDTTNTSFDTNGETGMTAGTSTDDTLASDVTISDSSSEAGSSTAGSSGSSEGSSSSEGGSSEAGSSESSGDTSMCEPITNDASAIGTTCEVDQDCPDGYTCYDGGGLVSMPMCQILCTQDCECPDGYTCQHMNIKGNEWDQCNPG